MKIYPPKWAMNFFRWFCREDYLEEIEGDLTEMYQKESAKSQRLANLKFVWRVTRYLRPQFIKSFHYSFRSNSLGMYKSYFKVGWRNLVKNKGYSFINIGGLAIGMAVTIFIGLWVYDELSFNKYHKNYKDIAAVWSCSTDPATGQVGGGPSMQYPVSIALRNQYPHYFKQVLLAWWPGDNTLSTEEKKFNMKGQFIEEGVIEMLSLDMLQGTYESMNDPHSIILSRSAAETIFGLKDPLNQSLTINNRMKVKVTGVFEDIPRNNRFSEIRFFAPWDLWLSYNEWAQRRETDWDNHQFNLYAQLQPGITMEDANAAIRMLYPENVPADFYKTMEKYRPFVQLIPMSTWHLYAELKDGKPGKGRITYVWLFGIVGLLVLSLACINFINLSTARSDKRAREVGVRKAIGSEKSQLVTQFLSESFMMVGFAFLLALALVSGLKGRFNELTDKDILLPFDQPYFWLAAVLCILLTGFIAGIYPAFYLTSFQPVKVLKGILRSGPVSVLPRKVLVVVQFTVSISLLIGTMVVYRQIQFGRNRPVGYDRSNLITLNMNDPQYNGKQDLLRTELLRTGVVYEIAAASSPMTGITNITNGYQWQGKDPNLDAEFVICNVTRDFGKTVGWEFVAGRDFSTEFSLDSINAIIVNEAAVSYMGLKDPIGQEFTDLNQFGIKKWTRTIIGVVKDQVMESPYEPVKPALYYYSEHAARQLHIKINPEVSAAVALPKIERVIKDIVPSALFDYQFVDEEYARKFSQEERIGNLSGVFAVLAVFISCLGLFGLASYVAEQRTKEIGIRKVMGASVSSLLQMLSRDFVILVIISSCIAVPIAWLVMHGWLQKYPYRAEISVWILLWTILGALFITIITISFQTMKAALRNPVTSLRSE